VKMQIKDQKGTRTKQKNIRIKFNQNLWQKVSRDNSLSAPKIPMGESRKVRRKFDSGEGEKVFVGLHLCFPKSLPSPAEHPFVLCAFSVVSLPWNTCFTVLLQWPPQKHGS
jgi:hypothetical protein